MKINSVLRLLAGLSLLLTACEEPKSEDVQGSALVESTSSKLTTAPDKKAFLLAVGDTIVNLAESAMLQLAEIPSEDQALFVAHPDKLPMVQAVLDRYGAEMERKVFESLPEKNSYLTTYPALKQKDPLHIKSDLTQDLDNGNWLYQRPILIRRRNCASCEEPSLVDYTAVEVRNLRAFSSLGKPEGYEVGDLRGVWQIHFPKDVMDQQ